MENSSLKILFFFPIFIHAFTIIRLLFYFNVFTKIKENLYATRYASKLFKIS